MDSPDDCNSLASGTHPSSTELDAGRIDHAAPAAGAYTPIFGASAPRRGGGGGDFAASTTTKTTSRRGATTTANATAPTAWTRTKMSCHRRRTGFRRFDLRNKERAGGIPPPPFAGPDNDNWSRQRMGNDEKESRRRTMLQHVGGGRQWQATRAGDGRRGGGVV